MIEFIADEVKVSGPRVDGSYTITFTVGQYHQRQAAEVMLIPQQTPIKVRIDTEEERE